jgi:Tfp pilus assembly protein PilP
MIRSRMALRLLLFMLVAAGCAKPDASTDDIVECFPTTVPLEQIKLRGTSPGATATIETPDGRVHVVKIGTMIGTKLGQVKAIREGVVVVEEQVRDAQGRRVSYDVELR